MDLRFSTPDLSALDRLGTEILVAGLAEAERPPRGVAGLVDWRLAGRLSRLIKRGFATGKLGEVVMISGKPKLPFDKIILVGLGRREEFEQAVFKALVERLLETLEGLKARTAVVELPGRHWGAVPAAWAADTLLEAVGTSTRHDAWTLVEPQDAQREVGAILQERRRIRRD